jgi:threonyl-tRNA synthetase
MKAIQLDVNSIEYEPIAPEIKIYEKTEKKTTVIKDALVLLIAIESGDTEAYASKAVKDATDFAIKQKIANIVFYPFAHLSSSLEEPQRAMNLLDYMVKEAEKSKLKVYRAPFGWNKRLAFSAKGHPLAEMFRSYGEEQKAGEKKVKKRSYDTSLVKKADWSGLPESDHRTIGEKQDLFSFQEVSPGMVYWHNNGYIVYKELVKYIREKLAEYGYQEIATPIIANTSLWYVSGHIDHYRENMFILDANDQELGLRPMGCPFALMLFKSKNRSYRELPLRYAEFDKIYRNEISGALSGLFRVRELTMDDAHIFVKEDQIASELAAMIKLTHELYSIFGLDADYKPKLSTMPDHHLGDEATWKKATDALINAMKVNNMKYEIKEKEGAFYAPKIDIDIKDAMGRYWQCATIQVDYLLPERFGLKYAGEDGKEHTPIMLHRAIYGSLERFIAILIEHLHGRLPTWLAPVQVEVIPISEQFLKHAEGIFKEIKASGVRVGLDDSDKTLDYKIKAAQTAQVPYMIVVGKKEVDAKNISVRSRTGKQKMGTKLDEFMTALKQEISERKSTQLF